jgi:hypothetical protein
LAQENYRKLDNLETHDLNFDHYEYVVNNMRHWDQMEIMLMGFTKHSLLKYFDRMRGITATYQGTPVLAAGHQLTDFECWYWFFGTPMVKDFFKKITSGSNHFIENSMRTYPYKRHVVQVWKKHQDSVKWLNMLKFYPFASYHVGAEEILLVERKRT